MTTKRNSFVSDVSALLDTEIGEGVTAFMGDVAESSDVDYIDVATDTETATENESKIKKNLHYHFNNCRLVCSLHVVQCIDGSCKQEFSKQVRL